MKRLYLVALLILFASGCVSQTAEGIRYYGQAQYDAAMTAFQSVLKTNPNDPNTLYNLAATYHQSAKVSLLSGQMAAAQQQYEQAAQYYQRCLSNNANHPEAYRGLATLHMDFLNPEAAFQLLLGWSQANPVSVEPKFELARLYQEYAQICMLQGRTEDGQRCRDTAEQYLQQIVKMEPNNYRAFRAWGYLKEQRGDIAGAIEEYRLSLLAYPHQKDLESRMAALTQ